MLAPTRPSFVARWWIWVPPWQRCSPLALWYSNRASGPLVADLAFWTHRPRRAWGLIDLIGVSKHYQIGPVEVRALDEVDLHVAGGAFVLA